MLELALLLLLGSSSFRSEFVALRFRRLPDEGTGLPAADVAIFSSGCEASDRTADICGRTKVVSESITRLASAGDSVRVTGVLGPGS